MAGPRLTDAETREIRAQFQTEFGKAYGASSRPLAKIGDASEYAKAVSALRGDSGLRPMLGLIDRQEASEMQAFKSARDAARLALIQWIKNKWYRQLAAGVAVGGIAAASVPTGGKVAQAGSQFKFAAGVAKISAAKAASVAKVGAGLVGSATLDAAAATAATKAANDSENTIKANIKLYFQTQRYNATIQRYRQVQRAK